MKEIKLTKGYVAIVDDEDYDRCIKYRWYAGKSSKGLGIYAYTKQWDGKKSHTIHMARFIMNAKEGDVIDHINGTPTTLDNRKYNLRIVNTQINSLNQGKRYDNTTGHANVVYHKQNKNFRSSVVVDGKRFSLGSYKTASEAGLIAKEFKARVIKLKVDQFNGINIEEEWDDLISLYGRKPKKVREIKEVRSTNNSGFRGVCLVKSGRWKAYTNDHNKQISLGVYDTPEEAGEVAKLAREKMYSERLINYGNRSHA